MFRQLERELRLLEYDTINFGESGKQSITDLMASLPNDLVEWTKKTRWLKNKPFSFEQRLYLLQLYGDLNKDISIVKPRQMEITEFSLNWSLRNLTTNPGTVGLYLSDRQSHVSIFSKMRLRSWAIAMSPILKQITNPCNTVSHMSFKNESHLYMYSAWDDFESARSIPADFAVIDEIQSTNGEAIPVLKEALSKSEFGSILKIGTGSIAGDPWSQMYHKGTQFEWDSNLQQWIAKNPTATAHSYHFTQYMAPWILPEKIAEKKRDYTPRRFTNEVEGLWYEGLQKPLVEKDIRNLFDRNFDFTDPENIDDGYPIFMGVDWGGGIQAFTVVWIWQLMRKNGPAFNVLNVIKIDDQSTETQADKVIELILKYNPKQVVVDTGAGARQIEKLSKRFNTLVYRCAYVSDTIEPCKISYGGARLVIDRTWIIETLIDLIKRPDDHPDFLDGIPRIHIPYMRPEKIDWVIENFTCIEAQTTITKHMSSVSYIHNPSSNDDALHAACYAYLAYLMHKSGAPWTYIQTT